MLKLDRRTLLRAGSAAVGAATLAAAPTLAHAPQGRGHHRHCRSHTKPHVGASEFRQRRIAPYRRRRGQLHGQLPASGVAVRIRSGRAAGSKGAHCLPRPSSHRQDAGRRLPFPLPPALGMWCARGAATAGCRQIGSGRADDFAGRGAVCLSIVGWRPKRARTRRIKAIGTS
jgi:hypothetical protein